MGEMKRLLYWLPLLGLLDLSGCGDSKRTFRTPDPEETGGTGGQSDPGSPKGGTDSGEGGRIGTDSSKGGTNTVASAGADGEPMGEGGDRGSEDPSETGGGGNGTGNTGEQPGTGGMAGAPGTDGDDTTGGDDDTEPGECSPGDTRSCAEAGWVGPCAEGTQVCGDDGTWGECQRFASGRGHL